ncbi:MAG: fibronectin type III domain-containing protein [Pseudomonadota bacterium]
MSKIVGLALLFAVAGCAGGGGGDSVAATVEQPTAPGGGDNTSGSIELTWTPPTAKADGTALTDLDGYRFYLGRQSGAYDRTINADNPGLSRFVIDNLQSGTWFVAMTSVRANGVESDLSNEVAKNAN